MALLRPRGMLAVQGGDGGYGGGQQEEEPPPAPAPQPTQPAGEPPPAPPPTAEEEAAPAAQAGEAAPELAPRRRARAKGGEAEGEGALQEAVGGQRPGSLASQQALMARSGFRLGAFDPRQRSREDQISRGGLENPPAISAGLSGNGPAGGRGFQPKNFEDEQRILNALKG